MLSARFPKSGSRPREVDLQRHLVPSGLDSSLFVEWMEHAAEIAASSKGVGTGGHSSRAYCGMLWARGSRTRRPIWRQARSRRMTTILMVT